MDPEMGLSPFFPKIKSGEYNKHSWLWHPAGEPPLSKLAGAGSREKGKWAGPPALRQASGQGRATVPSTQPAPGKCWMNKQMNEQTGSGDSSKFQV